MSRHAEIGGSMRMAPTTMTSIVTSSAKLVRSDREPGFAAIAAPPALEKGRFSVSKRRGFSRLIGKGLHHPDAGQVSSTLSLTPRSAPCWS